MLLLLQVLVTQQHVLSWSLFPFATKDSEVCKNCQPKPARGIRLSVIRIKLTASRRTSRKKMSVFKNFHPSRPRQNILTLTCLLAADFVAHAAAAAAVIW